MTIIIFPIINASQITRYFTKEELENRINELYKLEVKTIKQKVIEILNKIKENLSKEAERIILQIHIIKIIHKLKKD